ncbi:zinc finger protein [Saccharopolyspora tripterygii]
MHQLMLFVRPNHGGFMDRSAHPFHWAPTNGRRHAAADHVTAGPAATALCGEPIADDDREIDWLWPTCPSCYAITRRKAATPMPRETAHAAVIRP